MEMEDNDETYRLLPSDHTLHRSLVWLLLGSKSPGWDYSLVLEGQDLFLPFGGSSAVPLTHLALPQKGDCTLVPLLGPGGASPPTAL